MAIRSVVDSLDGMNEAVAALYTKDETSGKFKLAVEGMVEKSKVDEFRNSNIELNNKLKIFDGVDIEEVKKNAETARKLKEKELIEKGEVDTVIAERVKTLVSEHEAAIKTKDAALETAQSQLSVLLIDSQVRTHSLKQGVLADAADDVLLRAKTIFKIVDGKATAMDGDKPIYSKDGVTPLSVEEWVKGLQTTATHLFTPSTGSGAGGNRNKGLPNTANLSSTDKIKAGVEQRNNAR